jgi:hypothetical protein
VTFLTGRKSVFSIGQRHGVAGDPALSIVIRRVHDHLLAAMLAARRGVTDYAEAARRKVPQIRARDPL